MILGSTDYAIINIKWGFIMIETTVREIASMLHASVLGPDTVKIQGICIDSRKVENSHLYVPLIGQRADGHTFIEQVKEKGCAAALWQKDHTPYPENIALVLVEDTLKALQNLAKAYLQQLQGTIVAITGSNGKTSCKDMLYSICSLEKKTQKTQGNQNNEIGLPLTILSLDPDVEIIILEMGMENRNEISFLCSIAPPDISVITSIGSAHMENLGGKKQIAQAKLEILDHLKPGGLFLYDKDSPEIDECLKEMHIDPSKKIISFGTQGDIALTSDVKVIEDHICFSCSLCSDVNINSLGKIQAHNALPCIYIASFLGISMKSIKEGLSHLEMTGMRMQLDHIAQAKILNDAYKSNPESAKAAIDALMTLDASLHIACLGDMLDLGPDEVLLHEEIGDYAFDHGVDIVCGYGSLSLKMIEHCKDKKGYWFETKEEMGKFLRPYLQQDCAILVKGSRSMGMDVLVDILKGELK